MRHRAVDTCCRPARRHVIGSTSWLCVVLALPITLLTVACVPKDLTNHTEVGAARDVVSEPPVFPETGQVLPELLVEGLVYDFSTNQVDLNLWTPTTEEARCAAEAIVDSYGARLSDLGYEPGVDGAGINDIALTETERSGIVGLFTGCIDTEEMLGMLFLGNDHMHPAEADCMARGLAESELPRAMVAAWMNGSGFDPIGEDGSTAGLLLAYANVCLPADVFLWNGLQLPGADPTEGESVTSGDDAAGNESEEAPAEEAPAEEAPVTADPGS